MAQQESPSAQINMGGGPSKGKEKEKDSPDKASEKSPTSLRGKAPETFDGDRTKSKQFISKMSVYFLLNRKHPDVINCFSRVLLTLSFIKGENVVNWVNLEMKNVVQDLTFANGNEMEGDIWDSFQAMFSRNFVSTTQKEDALVLIKKLKMEGTKLDEYIATHATLVAELGWHVDSEMACHSFREGLPPAMAKNIIQREGMPTTMGSWITLAQMYHSRFAIIKALGYTGPKEKKKPQPTWRSSRSERPSKDPDTMDVDRAQMTPDERNLLMKAGKCFRCRRQGHLARECPTKASVQEAKIETPTQTPNKGKNKLPIQEDTPSYDSLAQQIHVCSMEERG